MVFFSLKHKREEGDQSLTLTELRLNESVIREFRLANTSASKRTIKAIVPTCKCTTVLRNDPMVAANSQGRFTVRVQPERLGKLDVNIKVSYLDDSHEDTFSIHSFVVPPTSALDLEPIKSREKMLSTSANLISGAEAVTLAASSAANTVIFVDVRAASAYRLGHIPASINLALASIRGRSFLKGREVILVDQGVVADSVMDVAKALRSAGFGQVRILNGGLQAWRNAGGSVNGSEPLATSLAELSPAVVFESARSSDWQIIGLEKTAARYRFGDLFAQVSDVSDATPASVKAALIPGKKHLLISKQGEHYHGLHQTLVSHQRSDTEIYYLAGGAEAYLKFLQRYDPPAQDRKWVSLAEYSGNVLVSSRNRTRAGGCAGCPN